MFKHKKISVFILIICILSFLLSSCFFQKSDEEMIESRINNFLKAYNSGDMNAVLECLDSKTKNTYQAAMNIGKALFKVSLSDLFGISVGTISDNDILTISDTEINILNDTQATVDVTLSYKDKVSDNQESASFIMVKENGDWFIKDLKIK